MDFDLSVSGAGDACERQKQTELSFFFFMIGEERKWRQGKKIK